MYYFLHLIKKQLSLPNEKKIWSRNMRCDYSSYLLVIYIQWYILQYLTHDMSVQQKASGSKGRKEQLDVLIQKSGLSMSKQLAPPSIHVHAHSIFWHGQSIVNILDAMSEMIQSIPSKQFFSPVTALHHWMFQWCVLMVF